MTSRRKKRHVGAEPHGQFMQSHPFNLAVISAYSVLKDARLVNGCLDFSVTGNGVEALEVVVPLVAEIADLLGKSPVLVGSLLDESCLIIDGLIQSVQATLTISLDLLVDIGLDLVDMLDRALRRFADLEVQL